jgi:hypothetical protein
MPTAPSRKALREARKKRTEGTEKPGDDSFAASFQTERDVI